MGLYNFQARFAPHIRAWAIDPDAPDAKGHTIRSPRKGGREDKPGDKMYLYTGLRTKAAKRIIEPVVCAKVESCVFRYDKRATHNGEEVWIGEFLEDVLDDSSKQLVVISNPELLSLHKLDTSERDQFARRDGFADFADMMEFWGARTLGGKKSRLPFYGHIFHWRKAD